MTLHQKKVSIVLHLLNYRFETFSNMIKGTSTAFETVGLFESVIDKKSENCLIFLLPFLLEKFTARFHTSLSQNCKTFNGLRFVAISTYTYQLFQIAQLSPIASPYVIYKLYITEL